MDILLKYFPNLSVKQQKQFAQLLTLYRTWNEKINVISRKDIENLYTKHVLHSLAIAKWITFNPGSRILDLGTGGGFPGIPLAIFFEDVQFHLVDSIRKKIKVVECISDELKLGNIKTSHSRVEDLQGSYDFIITRAVAKSARLKAWTKHLISRDNRHAVKNGVIALKGGDLNNEITELARSDKFEIIPLQDFFDENFFDQKALVYLRFGKH